ncbi:MAG: excinuclease ATPase subunit [Zoogloeaceae bacterium]|jgi:uncharacterized protein YbjQ (UPF0145 family)|nr:excinuclease ATPase subunit [Zoogloeaceae bacterium]
MKLSVKMTALAALLVSLSLCLPTAQARDDTLYPLIKDALELGKAQGKLDGTIKFYFSGQSHPAVASRLVQGAASSKKTNSANKSDEEACHWAMLSVLVAFQERARKEGGNAVINLESYYKKKSYKNKDKYECHAGSIMAGVALKGDVVRLSN